MRQHTSHAHDHTCGLLSSLLQMPVGECITIVGGLNHSALPLGHSTLAKLASHRGGTQDCMYLTLGEDMYLLNE